jgi:hypothetical protein
LELGAIERAAGIVVGGATAMLAFWMGWPVWLSTLSAIGTAAFATVGVLLLEGALEVRALKKRGLPLLDNWPNDAE